MPLRPASARPTRRPPRPSSSPSRLSRVRSEPGILSRGRSTPVKLGPSQALTRPTTPKYSISSRIEPVPGTNTKSPGPGAYLRPKPIGQNSLERKVDPSWSFSKSDRFTNDYQSNNLGPLQYKVKIGQFEDQDHGPSMGKRTPLLVHVADTLGPGMCRSDSFTNPHSAPNQKSAPSHSFGARRNDPVAQSERNPGPGRYDTAHSAMSVQKLSTRPSSPAPSLGMRTAFAQETNSSFTCREASTFKGDVQKKKGFSFGGRHKIADPTQVPGPGSYGNVQFTTRPRSSQHRSAPAHHIASGKDRFADPPPRSPGPGAYTPDGETMRTTKSGFAFGHRSGPPKAKTVKPNIRPKATGKVGPGSYSHTPGIGAQVDSRCRSAPSASMGSRNKFGSIEATEKGKLGVGPAAFNFAQPGMMNLPTQRSTPKAQFTAGRLADVEERERQRMPGPGTYDPQRACSYRPGFSLSSRNKALSDVADTYGPGRCRKDGSMGLQPRSDKRSQPSFTFGSRTKFRARHDPEPNTPGPGAYG